MKKLISLLTLQRDALVQQPKTAPATGKLLFDNYEHSLHSVRVICDEMGLNWSEKATICACIYQESRFNNKAKGYNKDHTGHVVSTDWGICQVNDFYNIGKGKKWSSVQQVLDNPEHVVRWMITCYKQGKLDLWSSYKSINGATPAYKQWLPKFM